MVRVYHNIVDDGGAKWWCTIHKWVGAITLSPPASDIVSAHLPCLRYCMPSPQQACDMVSDIHRCGSPQLLQSPIIYVCWDMLLRLKMLFIYYITEYRALNPPQIQIVYHIQCTLSVLLCREALPPSLWPGVLCLGQEVRSCGHRNSLSRSQGRGCS